MHTHKPGDPHHDHDHGHDHEHAHGHGHGHDHPEDHTPRSDHDPKVTEFEVLERALRSLLIDKGVISAADVQAQIDLMDSRTPVLGAKVIARAWSDPAYKRRLLQDARAALAELGIDFGVLAELKAVESTPKVHNVVVCTLCSCYPKLLLGIPPAWYKSAPYRSRVVVDPRGVLKEFGVEVPADTEVRVHDSTADLRYLVLPVRPKGTQGWSERQLTGLVTRDSMIGVGLPRSPETTVRKKPAARRKRAA